MDTASANKRSWLVSPKACSIAALMLSAMSGAPMTINSSGIASIFSVRLRLKGFFHFIDEFRAERAAVLHEIIPADRYTAYKNCFAFE